MSGLPPAPQGTDARAQFDAALAASHRGEAQAWSLLAAARERFVDEGDARCAMLARAALMVCGQVEGSYRGFAAGLADLAPLRDGPAGFSHRDDELLALNGLLIGLLMLRPQDDFLDACNDRVMALLEGCADVNLLLLGARHVLYYAEPREKRELGLRVHALVEARAGDPAQAPHRRARWLWMWQTFARYGKLPRESERAQAELHQLAQTHELRQIQFQLCLREVMAATAANDLPTTEAAITRAEALADPARPAQAVNLGYMRSRLARRRGEADTAVLHASRARKLAAELEFPPPTFAVYLLNEAYARLMGDDFAGARTQLQQAHTLVPAGFAQEIAEMIDGVTAYEALREGRSDGAVLLAALWRRLRERQFYDCFDDCPEFAARLCVLALQHDVEVDFVLSLIDKTGLVPPVDAPEHWPWPLRIRALGGFAVQRHGQPLASEGKAQKKPLALLQAVVAHGAWREGRGVDIDTLVDELWPDVEASDPKSSFEVTLSRLRKWLGVEGALRVSDGRLALNEKLVWCDLADFETTFQALQRQLAPHADAVPLPDLGRRLLGLYRGKLFGTSAIEPWAALARERAALQFTRAVTDYGHHLETQRAWSDALRLYEAGLTQDLLAEPIYRALMRCHLALGQPSEAQRVYQRCQDLLATTLKLRPAAETQALAARIAGDLPR